MAKKPPAPKQPQVQTIRAHEVEPEEMEFLWLDRIVRGAITLVGGRPGVGKSLFTSWLVAMLTSQGEACLMSNPEDALTWVKVPRLLAAKADPRLVHFWPGKMRLPEDTDALEELVMFHEIRLVTIDPIAKHIRSRDPNTALEPLAAMCERTGVSVVGAHHLIKRLPKDAHPLEAFGGPSGGWAGTARMAHILGGAPSGEEESRFLGIAKANFMRDDAPAIEFYLEEVEVDLPQGGVLEDIGRLVFVKSNAKVKTATIVHHKIAGGKYEASPEKKQVAAEFLTLLLSMGSTPAKDIFAKGAEHGVSAHTLRRAAESLDVVKTRRGWGPGSWIEWSLPPSHPALKSVGPPSAVDEAIDQILGGEDDGGS